MYSSWVLQSQHPNITAVVFRNLVEFQKENEGKEKKSKSRKKRKEKKKSGRKKSLDALVTSLTGFRGIQ